MRTRNWNRAIRRNRGGAMVEFALVLPALVLLCMAAGDFGRLYFHALTVVNAASSAVHWGSLDSGFAAQSAEMEDRAVKDASNLTGVTATSSMFCDCPPAAVDDFTTDPTPVDCSLAGVEGTCTDGAYGLPRVYVRTDVKQTFNTVGPYPGIPHSSEVSRSAYMRVQ